MSIRTEAKFRVSICGRWHPWRCDAIEWVSRDEFRAVGSGGWPVPIEDRCGARPCRVHDDPSSWIVSTALPAASHSDRRFVWNRGSASTRTRTESQSNKPRSGDWIRWIALSPESRSARIESGVTRRPRHGREFLNPCLMEAIGAETGDPTLEMTNRRSSNLPRENVRANSATTVNRKGAHARSVEHGGSAWCGSGLRARLQIRVRLPVRPRIC